MKFELILVTVSYDNDGDQEQDTIWGEVLGHVEAPYPAAIRVPNGPADVALRELGVRLVGGYPTVEGASMGIRTDRGIVAVRPAR